MPNGLVQCEEKDATGRGTVQAEDLPGVVRDAQVPGRGVEDGNRADGVGGLGHEPRKRG